MKILRLLTKDIRIMNTLNLRGIQWLKYVSQIVLGKSVSRGRVFSNCRNQRDLNVKKCSHGNELTEGLDDTSGPVHCEHYPLWSTSSLERSRGVTLTGAAEALLAHADEHVQTKIAIGRLVKMLESPHVLPVVLHILHKMGHKRNRFDLMK